MTLHPGNPQHEAEAPPPRVSVVVCAYNAAETLEDNLASLERLNYPDVEIILVNDGSKDRTSEIGHRHVLVEIDLHLQLRPHRQFLKDLHPGTGLIDVEHAGHGHGGTLPPLGAVHIGQQKQSLDFHGAP